MTTHTPDALLRIARRRLWAILLPALVVTAGASWWIHALPDRYRSDVLLLAIPQRLPETFVRSTVPARTDARLQSVVQQILSRTQLESIIRAFDLYAKGTALAAKGDNNRAIADFNSAIKLSPKTADLLERRAAAYRAKGDTAHSEADLKEAARLKAPAPRP